MQRYISGGENYMGDVLRPMEKINYDLPKDGYFRRDTDFIKRTQLYNVWLWKKFVEQFRIYGVDDNRWHDTPDGPNADIYAAFAYGSVLLAKDARLGDNFEESMNARIDASGFASFEYAETEYDEIRDARLYLEIENKDGGYTRLIDYSSAGKTLDERSRCAVWLKK